MLTEARRIGDAGQARRVLGDHRGVLGLARDHLHRLQGAAPAEGAGAGGAAGCLLQGAAR